MNPAIYYLSSFKRNEGLLYAYSLRRVVPGYTGPGIQVRRGTGTTTASFQDFHFNSSGELDQAAILSFVGAGAVGYVRTLYDQTGSGVDLGPIGAVVGREPRIVNSGSPAGSIVTKNGKIAMSFVAGGLNYLRTVTTLTHDVNNLSIFVVLSNTNLTLTQPCVTINNVSAVSEIIFPRSVGGSDYYNYNAGDAIVLGTTTTDNKVYSSLSTPTYITAFKNNISLPQVSLTNPAIGKSITLGYTTSNFIGTVQEVLIYENQKFNRSAITAEIMSYYSIV